MFVMLYLCRVKPLRHYLRGFLIAAWAGDKIAEFSFPEISFHFPLRPWFFCKPRVCGEKRLCAPPIASAVGSPPRMRGKVVAHCVRQNAVRITPACAGKSNLFVFRRIEPKDHPRMCGEKLPLPAAFCVPARDHPRMCGEKPVRSLPVSCIRGSPPHVRGKD